MRIYFTINRRRFVWRPLRPLGVLLVLAFCASMLVLPFFGILYGIQ